MIYVDGVSLLAWPTKKTSARADFGREDSRLQNFTMRPQSIEEEEEELQAKATSGRISEVNPNLESHIQSLKG